MGGAAVVTAIFISACVAGYQAIARLIDPEPITGLGVLALAGAIGFAGNVLVHRDHPANQLQSWKTVHREPAHAHRGVPVAMRVSGRTLMLDVPHRDRELMYPISVDPFFSGIGFLENDDYRWNQGESSLAGWSYWASHNAWGRWGASFHDAVIGQPARALHLYGNAGWFDDGNVVEYSYQPRGQTTRIFQARFWNTRIETWGQGESACTYSGIFSEQNARWETDAWGSPMYSQVCGSNTWAAQPSPRYCPRSATQPTWQNPLPQCYPTGGTPQNRAIFGLVAKGTGARGSAFGAWNTATEIAITDPEVPRVIVWQSTSGAPVFNVAVEDPGVGVNHVKVTAPAVPGWTGAFDDATTCIGTHRGACPARKDHSLNWGNLTGPTQIRIEAWDGLGQYTDQRMTWNPPHFASVRFGGSNRNIDTDAELNAAISAMGSMSEAVWQTHWNALLAEDRADLAAADAFIRWGAAEPLSEPSRAQGLWEVSGGARPVGDDYIPRSDVLAEPADTDPVAYPSAGPFTPIIAVCFKKCDDVARNLIRRGKGGLKKVKLGRPKNWRQMRPDEVWVKTSDATPRRSWPQISGNAQPPNPMLPIT